MNYEVLNIYSKGRGKEFQLEIKMQFHLVLLGHLKYLHNQMLFILQVLTILLIQNQNHLVFLQHPAHKQYHQLKSHLPHLLLFKLQNLTLEHMHAKSKYCLLYFIKNFLINQYKRISFEMVTML